ncbi:MAG: hypothetical protein CL678_15785 [Bdellovibrionaceae bacterium]|nr:hypothetical protein [Pseudobdellovibrionaceae bacterium]
MPNRTGATKFILEFLEEVLPGGGNKEIYEEYLSKMSDEDFGRFIDRLDSGEEILNLIAPIMSEAKLNVQRNLAIARKLGHEFLERLWVTDPFTGETYLTPERYMVVDLPLRRQIQMLMKKISIPDDNRHVDELTGQPTGTSKGSKLSFPEIQVMHGQGLSRTIEELIKYRGGDEKAFNAMNRSIIESGGVSLDAIAPFSGGVRSTETLGVYLKAMHLDNNAAES